MSLNGFLVDGHKLQLRYFIHSVIFNSLFNSMYLGARRFYANNVIRQIFASTVVSNYTHCERR